MRPTPYKTKSGLQIGCRWDPPTHQRDTSYDMERLQKALLLNDNDRVSLLDITTWIIGVLVLLATFIFAMII